MAVAYIPPGHVGLVEATFRLTERLYPERWPAAGIPDWEANVWTKVRSGLSRPDLLLEHLRVAAGRARPDDISVIDRTGMLQRFADFCDARKILRDALVSGSTAAMYHDDAGLLQTVAAPSWASESGDTVLWNGSAWISENETEEVNRFLFVRESIVDDCSTLPATDTLNQNPTLVLEESGIRSGFPGRPSPKNLVIQEAERWLQSGEPMPESLNRFAMELSTRLERDYPHLVGRGIKPDTIRGNSDIRAIHRRRLKA